jgi:hypothetical protein
MLAVEFNPGYTPSVGDSFDLLDFDHLSGGFELASLPLLGLGMRWDTSALLTEGTVVVDSGLAADFNLDGVVDAADYTVWRNHLGAAGPGLAADANADLRVDEADYLVWKGMFGAAFDNPGTLLAAVPEPPLAVAATLLLPLALLLVGMKKRGLATSVSVPEHARRLRG